MERDGLEQQEAELLIDNFRTNLASLLSEAGAEMEEDDADIFSSAQDLFADEFDVDLDYLDEFWEEAK